MSRKSAFLEQTGVCCHAFNRGVNREQIFYTPHGYALFMNLIQKYLDAFSVNVLAYCLMPNHFHLILRQNKPYAVALFMHMVCMHYANALNQWLRRSGHLFGSRYKLIPVDDPIYMLQLSRYIHLNPVKAGLADSANGWEYSSSKSYCGLSPAGRLDTTEILSQVGGAEHYREFLESRDPGYPEGSVRYMIDWDDDEPVRQRPRGGVPVRQVRSVRPVATTPGQRQSETATRELISPSHPYLQSGC